MSDALPVIPAGDNATRLWGLTAQERLRRIGAVQGHAMGAAASGPAIVANLAYVFDPAWLKTIAARPATILLRDGIPVLANVPDAASAAATIGAMTGAGLLPATLAAIAYEHTDSQTNTELRKREKPFLDRLEPATVPALERQSYFGAYKGVTDLLTKYLWPEWALVLTRLAARAGITPNQVTYVGILGCLLATIAFWHGWYWTGMAVGLGFMVLDTVDGKLARCTITSSRLGDVLDHGVDLVHPPFWWYAWGWGLYAYGRPLSTHAFAVAMIVILVGYVVQRLIEGAFIAQFGMHIHVWRRFDSRFRLITARRNPNMVILFASVVAMRPDWGLVAVAGWTALSCAVHLVRLVQAWIVRGTGRAIESWLA